MNKTQAKYLISDELWAKIEPLLPARPPHCHNLRVDDRKAMSAIFFVPLVNIFASIIYDTGQAHWSAPTKFPTDD